MNQYKEINKRDCYTVVVFDLILCYLTTEIKLNNSQQIAG